MPVLLLARGDAQARDMLRRAIEARYGVTPPAIDSLKIDFKGRVRARVGPITTWIPVDIMAQFRFPNAMRLDFTVRPAGVTVQRGIEGFDGTTYQVMRGGSNPNVIDDPESIRSHRSRLWAIAAVLLTPLGEHFVELQAPHENTFSALNTLFGDSVRLRLRPDNTLESVTVMCQNPDTQQQQLFSLHMSAEQSPIDTLMLPSKVSAFWDTNPYFEVQPVRVDANPAISDAVFTLQAVD
jgi:hypothetical protein